MSSSMAPAGGSRNRTSLSPNPTGTTRSLSPRIRHSRSSSAESAFRYATDAPENLLFPDGQIGEETAELLQEFVHPHHEAEETLAGDESPGDIDLPKLAEERRKLPWHKRPSPWWFLATIALSAFVIGATIAPRIEVYTQLVCDSQKRNYTVGRGEEEGPLFPMFSGNYTGYLTSDKERSRLCAADPDVGASVATLVMVYTTGMGILGCLTTGWWTSLSDRAGRIRILGICLCGALSADFNFIFVGNFSRYLPGSYWWFVLGALVDGIFGGSATLNATLHAYVADVVEPHNRAHIFSLFYGLLFSGFAVGPTLGGLIVRFSGTPLSVFYISAGYHFLLSVFLWVFVPESLTKAQQAESRRQYHESIAKGKRDAIDAPILYRFKRLFSFLSPLTVLWTAPEGVTGNPLKAKSRKGDWSLILMATSSGFALLMMGSYSYKFQYTSAVFGWTSEQIGYWLSIVGFVRAAFLTLVFPLIIKLFKPKPPQPIQLVSDPDEPLQPPSRSSSRTRPAKLSPSQSISFDLNVARISVFIEFLSMFSLPFTRNPLVFTALSVANCFGAGHAPAAQSVTLALYAQRGGIESGKLLGALGVLQILSSQIVGPALFGMTYVKTVATLPATIFFVSSVVMAFSFIALLFVRVPHDKTDVEEPTSSSSEGDRTPTHLQDETLVDVDVPVIVVDAASPKIPSVSTRAESS